MAYINEKGEIELTHEDRQTLNEKKAFKPDNWINWIIWGNKKHYYNKNINSDF